MRELTDQERFWKGSFGDDYIERNKGDDIIASNISMFAHILKSMRRVTSAIEFGSNIGLNLTALHQLLPHAELTAVEINEKAFAQLRKLEYVNACHSSIYDFDFNRTWDLSFTGGVLIHQAPEMLPKAYELLYKASNRYVMIAEYYNPTPVEVSYRGNSSVLYKRDFAGEMLDTFPDLSLIDYGFLYHRDSQFLNGDATWFLMEKRNS